MTKPIPQIQKFMTMVPHSVTKDSSLLVAAQLMQKEHIRHLPVTYNDRVEGILSETDVHMIRTLKNVDIEKMKVMDCYTPNPYIVAPTAHLDEVMNEMAEHKYGCVLVEDNKKLVGIFTWIDALKATAELLHTRLK